MKKTTTSPLPLSDEYPGPGTPADEESLPEPAGKNIQEIVERWYTNKLSDPVGREGEQCGEQVLDAVVTLPERIAATVGSIAACDIAIDDWFAEHFHKAPVSENTRLYNTLHAAKEELKAMLSAGA